MTNETATISTVNINSLTPVLYKERPVITTELLAQVYETEEKNIQMNFSRNQERFEEGVHFFKLQSGELKEFKNQPSFSGLVHPQASHLMLWTEKGASRHCKMLDTAKAWQRFDELEDTYFKVKEVKEKIKQAKDSYQISDPVERAQRWIEEAKEKRLLASQNEALVQQVVNLEPYKEYVEEISDSVTLHTVNTIASQLKMSAIALNKTLEARGIVYRQGKLIQLCSELRNKGLARMVTHKHFDEKGDLKTVDHLKWTERGRKFIFLAHDSSDWRKTYRTLEKIEAEKKTLTA